MIGNFEGTVQDLNKPTGISINNYYSYFTSCLLIDTSYRWSTESDFISEPVMLAGIKAGSIIPIHDIKVVDYIGEEDVYETSTQDNAYISRPGKDRFILKFDYDISFHKRLKSYDHKDYNIVFVDINNNIYGWLNGSLIDGFQTDLIHTQKMVWGSTPEHAWSKMRIDLHDTDQLNKYGVIKSIDYDINDMYFLNVVIQNISSYDENTIIFQVVDSIYGCGISGIGESGITITDIANGVMPFTSIKSTVDGYYTIISSLEFTAGAIVIDTERYYDDAQYNFRGDTWVELTSTVSTTLSGIDMYDSSVGFVVGSANVVLKTDDGGDTFNLCSGRGAPTINYNSVAVNPLNSNMVWVCGSGGTILRSTDGFGFGTETSGTTEALLCIVATYTTSVTAILMAGGFNGTLITSNNGGITWTPLSPGTSNAIKSICIAGNYNRLYLCGENGMIKYSTFGGIGWGSLSSGVTGDLQRIIFTSTYHGWCGGSEGSDGKLLLTTDGITWTTKYTFTGKPISDMFFLDANTGYVATTTGELYNTIDGGDTFELQDITPTGYIRGLDIVSLISGFVVCTDGQIFKYG